MLASKPNVTPILPHPPAPTTLEEAGLSLDIVIQLVLKTLHFTGELPGSELAQRLGLRLQRHRAGTDAHQVAAPGRGRGRRHDRRAVVPLPDHRRGAHAGAAVPRDQPLRRRRAGAPRRSTKRYMAEYKQRRRDRDARPRAPGIRAPRHQRSRDGPARARDQRRPLDVRLRASGQRQDGHLAGDPETARRRHPHPACARDRGRHRPALRPGHARGVA